MPKKKQSESFTGFESFSGMTLSESEGLISGVKLAGSESRNGYTYTQEALESAVSLYEGQPVFLDHSENPTRPHQRSARDLAGYIRNPRYSKEGVFGDIETIETEAGQTLRGLAKSGGSKAGMSHVVLARRSPDKTIVEKIEEVVSVDAVVFPATTKTFFESILDPESPELKEEEMDLSKLTLEEIKSGRPDLVKSLLSEQQTSDEAKQIAEQLKETKAELAEIKKKHGQQQLVESIKTELKEAGFDISNDKVVSETFMGQLLTCENADVRKVLIDDRKGIIGQMKRLPAKPTSSTPDATTGNLSEAMGMSAKEVLASIQS